MPSAWLADQDERRGNEEEMRACSEVDSRPLSGRDACRLSNRLATAFLSADDRAFDGSRRPVGGRFFQGEEFMSKAFKTVIAAAAFAALATSAFSQGTWDFKPGMAYMYAGPGKMSAMAMAPGAKNHEAMMKHATKVPNNTVFFMDNGQLYSVSGTLDPTGNFYRP
jgi:hypothetical protein